MLLGYGYMRNNLVRLGGYPTHRDVADMSYSFYFYFVFKGTLMQIRKSPSMF